MYLVRILHSASKVVNIEDDEYVRNSAKAPASGGAGALKPCGPRLSASPLTKSEAAEAAEAFKAMASAERLQLLSLIAAQPGGECGCNLLEPTELAQPTVSYHLKLLYQAGLVEREQRGTSVYFRVRRAGLETIRRLLDEFDR